MNDGSVCPILHRLEDVGARDTRVDAPRETQPGRRDEPPMLSCTFDSYAVRGQREGRGEVDLRVGDVVVVVLPGVMNVAMKR